MLILILPSFFKFSFLYNTYGHFSSKFSQKLLDLGLRNLSQFCLFSGSVSISDGYRRGHVSLAHFLLYFPDASVGGGGDDVLKYFSISYMYNTKRDHLSPKIKRYFYGNKKSDAKS